MKGFIMPRNMGIKNFNTKRISNKLKRAQSLDLEEVVNEVVRLLKSRYDADIEALPSLLEDIKEGVIDKFLGQLDYMYDEMN